MEPKNNYLAYLAQPFNAPILSGRLQKYAAIAAQMCDGLPKKKGDLLSQCNITPKANPKDLRNQLSVLFSKLVTHEVLDYNENSRMWKQGAKYNTFLLSLLEQIPDLFTEEVNEKLIKDILSSPIRINKLKKYFKINNSQKPKVIRFLDKLTDYDFIKVSVTEKQILKEFVLQDLNQLLKVIENKTALISKEKNSIKIFIKE